MDSVIDLNVNISWPTPKSPLPYVRNFNNVEFLDAKTFWVFFFYQIQGPLVRWLKVNFSEAFIAWIHVKALRVFVESVLRYD